MGTGGALWLEADAPHGVGCSDDDGATAAAPPTANAAPAEPAAGGVAPLPMDMAAAPCENVHMAPLVHMPRRKKVHGGLPTPPTPAPPPMPS
jgi:hypothetical protein